MKRNLRVMVAAASAAAGQRVVVPLDGTWQIEYAVAANAMPKTWGHKAPVPGLANLAVPAFAGGDLFGIRELIDNRIRAKEPPVRRGGRVRSRGLCSGELDVKICARILLLSGIPADVQHADNLPQPEGLEPQRRRRSGWFPTGARSRPTARTSR